MMGMAAKRGMLRTRKGPKDDELRKARVCYNHLAGDMGVQLFDSLIAQGYLAEDDDEISLTDEGAAFAQSFGIDLSAIIKGRRPLCRSCLDWSSRRTHLAGALGSAFLSRIQDLKWASRRPDSRVIVFSRNGEKKFLETFPV